MCTPFAQPTLAAEWLVRSPGDAAECPNARTLDVKAPREGRLYVSEHKTGTTKPNSGINANSAYFELLGARPAQRSFHHEVEDEGPCGQARATHAQRGIQDPRGACRIARRQNHGRAVPGV